jgi:hypothetical protein
MKKCVSMSRLAFSASLFLLSLPALAQNSQLEGRVIDASQAIVGQAVITVTRTDSGLQREVLSNDQGLYAVPLLPPGQYHIVVNKVGFKPLTRTGIVLETGVTSTVDLQLEVGGVNESVTVEAAAPLLQPETSSVAHVVDGQSIQDLPLIDRRAAQLIGLNGFVVQNGSGLGSTFGIAGGRANNSMYTLDGESTQNLPNIGVATLAYDPPVESLQEFNVAMSNYAAELGRTGGGVIQMTTKSGTNALHGSAYEFFRNDDLNARTFFAAHRPILRYNLFGASVGGPIKKNKTFFFYNYEGLRNTTYVATILGVPTVAETQGNFSADKFTVKDPTTKTPFPGNIIPANLLDPVGAKLASFFPAPNVSGQLSGHNNFLANQATGVIGNNHIARIDHMFREKDRIFGRFVGYTTPTYTGSVFSVAAEDPAAVKAHTSYYNTTGTWYHDFSPAVLNEFRTGFDLRSSHTYSSGAGSNINQSIGLSGVDPTFAPNVIVPGYTQMGTTTQQRFQIPTLAIPVIDHMTVIRGRHQFKFGAEYRYASDVDYWQGIAGGQVSFNTTATGSSLAALELGWVTSAQIVNTLPLKPRGDNYNAFVQDDWKVTPTLTLNVGLRWDLDEPRWEVYGNRQNGFNPTAINPVSGTPGIVTFSGLNGVPKYANNWNYHNLGPRFGFAWRLPKNFVVRGGAALLYVGPYDMATPITANLGFSDSASFVSPNNGITPAFLLSDGFPANSVPSASQLTPGYGAVPVGHKPTTAVTYYQQTGRKTGYLEQYNFNVQKQLSNSVLVEVGGLGTFGHALPVPNQNGVTINQVPTALLGSGNAQILRPFPQFSDVRTLAADMGSSKYYGINLHVEKRASNGLSLQGNYTFSRFEDNIPGRNELGDPGGALSYYNTYLNMNNRAQDWGLSGNDIKHRLVASVIYELPYGKGRAHAAPNAFLDKVAGGWSLAYTGELHSGSPYGVMEAVNLTNSFSDGNRANVVGNPVLSSNRPTAQKIAEWFNTGAFAAPAAFTFGNAGRTAGYGPGAIGLNLSLLKDFHISERHDVQFRAEALNFINHANFALPNVQQGSAAFGTITSLVPGNQSRIIQLGLHYRF